MFVTWFTHYAACIFKYIREYSTRLSDVVAMVCTEDNIRSVGEPEPGTPIAILLNESTMFVLG